MNAKASDILGKDDFSRLQELRFAVDQAALMARIQPSAVLIDANDKFLQVFGFAQEEIFKTPFKTLLSDDFRDIFSEHILTVLGRGIIWKGELSHRARNGSLFWTEATLVPVLDKQRHVLYYHFIAFEVTERKAVESALTNNSIFITRLMDLAPTGFFLADSKGNCTYINKMWSEISGCRLREALGMGWIQSVFPPDQAGVREAWWRFVSNGEDFHREYRYAHSSGRITWVEAVAERVEFTKDAKMRYIRVENDLTERKESESLINEQRAQMVASSKMSALGEMAGGIAHEINNPLAILQLRAKQILQVAADAPQSDLLNAAAKNIHLTTDRIAAIVRALRAIAREGRRDPFLLTSVSSLIADTMALSAARFRSYEIGLTVRPFTESMEIRCRSVEVLQILMNLLNNAFSAVQSLPEKWVEISIHDIGSSVEIWITDSGAGIPAELHDKLFQPFFTTKPIGSGTGLGLSICKAMALDHQGDLFIDDSSPHTRFVLILPKEPMNSPGIKETGR